ncbi:MAG: hypothetical protein WCI88_15415 [Chloroflexota bacterium]
MEGLRIIKHTTSTRLTINLPVSLVGRDVEVIVLPTEPPMETREGFHPEAYFGIYRELHLDADQEAMDLRNEWERNF